MVKESRWKKFGKTLGSYLPFANEFNLFFKKKNRDLNNPPLERIFLSAIYRCTSAQIYGNSPKVQEQIRHNQEVKSHVDSIFQDAKTYEDSLKIWKEYQIPLGRDLNFEDKDKIYKLSLEEKFKQNEKIN